MMIPHSYSFLQTHVHELRPIIPIWVPTIPMWVDLDPRMKRPSYGPWIPAFCRMRAWVNTNGCVTGYTGISRSVVHSFHSFIHMFSVILHTNSILWCDVLIHSFYLRILFYDVMFLFIHSTFVLKHPGLKSAQCPAHRGADPRTHSTPLTLSSSLRVKGLTRRC